MGKGMRALAVLSLVLGALPATAQQPARDAARPAAVGTASVSGIVLLDAAERKPIRRARVTLNNAELQVRRTIVTEDDGTFVFRALPAGRYLLAASKDGYVTVNHGASRPTRPGTPIVVGNGENPRVTLRLPRGAVITGTVLDVDGSPAPAIGVRVMRYAFVSGERQLVPAGNAATTDDRGVYRVYGLPAGDYCVAASPRNTQYGSGEIQLMTAADLRRALDELREGASAVQARPGMAGPASTQSTSETARVYGYATVYYPGTTIATESPTVTVRPGEERSGIDIQVQLSPMARVSGTLTMPDGSPPPAAMVNLMPAGTVLTPALTDSIRFSRTIADGKFSFAGIPPGRYSIMSRGSTSAPASTPDPAAASGSAPPLWGMAELNVEGADISDVTITLQMGLTLAGQITFDGTSAPPSDLTRLRVNLQPVQASGEMTLVVPPAPVSAQGQFNVTGVTPGRYRLTASIPGASPDAPGWWLTSSVVSGRETLDVPIDLRESSSGAVITFSDKSTEIAGAARDVAGAPTPACFVIAAALDRAYWTVQSRRVAAVRPNSEGQFSVKNLPPGDYFVAAVADVEQGEWFDPRFLEQLLSVATRITLADGERKAQDVAVVR